MQSDNTLEELVNRIYEDPVAYFQVGLKVEEFGTGLMVPFELNPAQMIVHAVAEKQLKEQNMVRIIVLKARRLGMSTYVQGRYFAKAATRTNRNVQIVTHSRSATNSMFNMARRFEENLPEEIKPEVRYSGKNELVWSDLGSSYSLATVGGKEVRGSKVDLLHCSEVAFWGDGGNEYLLGVLNTVVQGYQTEAFLESTANGVGGIFYERWKDAEENPASGWASVFVPYFVFSEYRLPFKDDKEKQTFKDSLGQDPAYGGEEEEKLLGHYAEYSTLEGDLRFQIDLETLKWRRQTIDVQCNGDIDLFRQEYPCNASEAFLTTGRSVFDKKSLHFMQLEAEKRVRETPPGLYNIPVKQKRTDTGLNRYYLERADDEGELIVWTPPQSDREYRIGCDVSEGIEIGTRDTDWSVAIVLDALTYEEQAILRTRIDPDLLAWKLVSLGRWYNNAMLAVESNNHGLVSLKFLQEIHQYPNLYYDKILDERSNRATRKLGFKTTLRTKPVIIDNLRELVREREIKLHNKTTLDEMASFVFQSNGSMSAATGSHDDCVMSLAIAAFATKLYPGSTRWKEQMYQPEKKRFSLYHAPGV